MQDDQFLSVEQVLGCEEVHNEDETEEVDCEEHSLLFFGGGKSDPEKIAENHSRKMQEVVDFGVDVPHEEEEQRHEVEDQVLVRVFEGVQESHDDQHDGQKAAADLQVVGREEVVEEVREDVGGNEVQPKLAVLHSFLVPFASRVVANYQQVDK